MEVYEMINDIQYWNTDLNQVYRLKVELLFTTFRCGCGCGCGCLLLLDVIATDMVVETLLMDSVK